MHVGNVWFRRLVVSNRPLYHSCPKHTKLLVAKAIVQAVQQQDPPGRFLEKADVGMKLWREVDQKRCVHKTSQALRERERASDVGHESSQKSVAAGNSALKEIDTKLKKIAENTASRNMQHKRGDGNIDLTELTNATLSRAGFESQTAAARSAKRQQQEGAPGKSGSKNTAKNKSEKFIKPAWWQQGLPPLPNSYRQYIDSQINQGLHPNKRRRTSIEDPTPLPPDALQNRQSSLFNFLKNTRIFGRESFSQGSMMGENTQYQSNMGQGEGLNDANTRSSGLFSFSGGAPKSFLGDSSSNQQQQMRNPSFLLSTAAANIHGSFSETTMTANQVPSSDTAIEPLPFATAETAQTATIASTHNMHGMSSHERNSQTGGEGLTDLEDCTASAPPLNRLTSQLSDWFTSLMPTSGKQGKRGATTEEEAPLPENDLERSVSSSIFGVVRSPSQFLTNLKSGVTSIFGGTSDLEPVPIIGSMPPNSTMHAPPLPPVAQSQESTDVGKRDSLLDDYEETPMEARLRMLGPH